MLTDLLSLILWVLYITTTNGHGGSWLPHLDIQLQRGTQPRFYSSPTSTFSLQSETGVGKWVVIHAIPWITRVATI